MSPWERSKVVPAKEACTVCRERWAQIRLGGARYCRQCYRLVAEPAAADGAPSSADLAAAHCAQQQEKEAARMARVERAPDPVPRRSVTVDGVEYEVVWP